MRVRGRSSACQRGSVVTGSIASDDVLTCECGNWWQLNHEGNAACDHLHILSHLYCMFSPGVSAAGVAAPLRYTSAAAATMSAMFFLSKPPACARIKLHTVMCSSWRRNFGYGSCDLVLNCRDYVT
jgi:hypothetical protein